jgi:DnaJ domain
MKLDSKYFDSIRIRRGDDPQPKREVPSCQWKGCGQPAQHRAPKGRGRDGQFYAFCLDHVRQYNATYNYFDGMSDAEVEDFQKDALTGHRPTWKTGANAWAHGTNGDGTKRKARSDPRADERISDPHAFFAWRAKRSGDDEGEARRRLKPLEAKALEKLNLEPGATRQDIKTRFKELVKRHHPDANGGDTRSEDRLREIIQAYNQLKQAGLA